MVGIPSCTQGEAEKLLTFKRTGSAQPANIMVKIFIIGHLGKDAIINNVNGKPVINFSVAHTEKYTDPQGAKQEKTQWFDCAKWGDQTAVAQYLTKGTQVFIDGSPELKTFQKQDGTTGAAIVVRVGSLQLLGSPQQANASAGFPQQAQNQYQAPNQGGAGYPPAQQYPNQPYQQQPGHQHQQQPYGQPLTQQQIHNNNAGYVPPQQYQQPQQPVQQQQMFSQPAQASATNLQQQYQNAQPPLPGDLPF